MGPNPLLVARFMLIVGYGGSKLLVVNLLSQVACLVFLNVVVEGASEGEGDLGGVDIGPVKK